MCFFHGKEKEASKICFFWGGTFWNPMQLDFPVCWQQICFFSEGQMKRKTHGSENFDRLKWVKVETGQWDQVAKGDLAMDSSHLPGKVATAPRKTGSYEEEFLGGMVNRLNGRFIYICRPSFWGLEWKDLFVVLFFGGKTCSKAAYRISKNNVCIVDDPLETCRMKLHPGLGVLLKFLLLEEAVDH